MFSISRIGKSATRRACLSFANRIQHYSFHSSLVCQNAELSTNISYDDLIHRVNNWPSLGPHTYSCPVCKSGNTHHFHSDRTNRKFARVYYRCASCALTFVPPSLYLSPSEEKIRYDVHINDASDPRYRQFLRQAIDPLMNRLVATCRSLPADQPIRVIDYGCGPGPASPLIFKSYVDDMEAAKSVSALSQGAVTPSEVSAVASRIECVTYDPFFSPHVSIPASWSGRDAVPPPVAHCPAALPADNMAEVVAAVSVEGVVNTEVIEHAHEPVQLVQRLVDLLSARGVAVVMTTVLEDDAAFNAWGYRNDLTHVCFFKEQTMQYIAREVGATVERVSRNVFLFSRVVKTQSEEIK